MHSPSRVATEAAIKVDGGGVFDPAVTQFAGANSEAVGTPAIDSGFTGDIYLTVTEFGGVGTATGAEQFPEPAPPTRSPSASWSNRWSPGSGRGGW